MTHEYVLDLSGGGPHTVAYDSHGFGTSLGGSRQYEDFRSPIAVMTIGCAWVGAVVLPADKKAMKGPTETQLEQQGAAASDQPEAGAERQGLSFDDWYKRTRKWIRALNKKKAPLVEVEVYTLQSCYCATLD